VSLALILIASILFWLVKEVLGELVGQQFKGSIPDYTARKARAAARLLPDAIAAEYEQDWLAELEALEGKPLSALRYAHGLGNAARSIGVAVTGYAVPSRSRRILSRAWDLNNGVLALIALAPALLTIGLMLKLDSRGPILWRRRRRGKDGEPFDQFCFRTHTWDPNGRFYTSRVGEVITMASLQTLPSWLNVLRGNMSVIGPPPQTLSPKPTPPLGVRPGLISWQRLTELGGTGIDLAEARRRDRVRTLVNDVSLIARQLNFALRYGRGGPR
jgi:hypothetical protein